PIAPLRGIAGELQIVVNRLVRPLRVPCQELVVRLPGPRQLARPDVRVRYPRQDRLVASALPERQAVLRESARVVRVCPQPIPPRQRRIRTLAPADPQREPHARERRERSE